MSSRTGERARGGTSGQVMPRVAVSKSRGDKSRTVTVAPLPQVSVDIIPGRFTEDDWISMVVTEDGEDVVGEIVDSLIDRVMEECLIVHLQKQVVLYTVSQARDAMVQIVQWTFVPRDEGDNELDTDRNRQEEPQPCPHDSWAQGCVPVTQPARTPSSQQPQVSPHHPITDIPEQEGEETPQAEEPPGGEEPLPVSPPQQMSTAETSSTRAPQLLLKPSPPTGPPITRPRYRPHRGPLRSAGLKNITKSLEETEKEIFLEQLFKVKEENVDENLNLLPTSLHNILKIQLGRPPQKKDVIYDHAGNVLSVPKVDLSRLPQHHVRPRIEVLDISRDLEYLEGKSRVTGKGTRSRRVDRRSGAACKLSPIRRTHVLMSGDPPQLLLHDEMIRTCIQPTTTTEDIPGPTPVSAGVLLDTMPLSQGVILREGDAIERGSVYSLRVKEESKKLRPIPAAIPLPILRVEQLIKNNVPQVQPLLSMSH
ncbi:uncharacterized protein C2orf81 homolog [Rhinoderma darwinii]|uniref:uncharacterized protein C2orf81 homolog n=1 Tax=Rhinoderma darwinii TaxID=43563 RepID=UPI003F67632C